MIRPRSRITRRGSAAALALLASLLLALLALGCTNAEEAAVRRTVEEYNELLPAAYARPEPNLMSELTDEEELNRIVMYVLYLKKKGEIIDNRLLKLEVRDVDLEREGTRATARTVESWEYRMLDMETRQPKGGVTRKTYEGVYTLRKDRDRWVVVRLDVDEKAGEGR